jgi:tetratricopeptide (TPR) repeat protein
LTAIFCGGAVLALTRGERQVGAWRWPIFTAGALIGLIALVGLAGRLELAASSSATQGADWGKAAADARHARTLMPWSAEPWRALGDAQLGQGQRAEAIASYKHAIAKSPRDYTTWIQLAKADRGRARWYELAVALKLNPLNAGEIRQVAQQLLAKDGA